MPRRHDGFPAEGTFQQELKDKIWRLQNLYHIKTKRRGSQLLRFNTVQEMVVDKAWRQVKANKPIRQIDIKTRQQGLSTLWLVWWLDDTIFTPNTNTGILAHKKESLNYLMEIVRYAHHTMPKHLRLPTIGDNKTELAFKYNNSKIFCSLSIRSTTLHNLHISEWCLCKNNEIEATIGATSEWTNISGESTGKGVGNHGYDTYQEAKKGQSIDGFESLFLPWFLQEEYQLPCELTLEQLKLNPEERALQSIMLKEWGRQLKPTQVLWRRNKKKRITGIFKQEYPADDDEAFLTSGVKFFNFKKLHVLLKEAKDFNETPPAGREVWKEGDDWIAWEKPDPTCVYAAGADTQDQGRDMSVLKIINVTRHREAFRYRARCGYKTFYKICNEWGRAYNNALLAVERNNHGHAVLLGLEENCHYPRLWKEDKITRLERKIHVGRQPRPVLPEVKYGWTTGKESRPLMLDQVKLAVEGDDDDDEFKFQPAFAVLDQEFLEECLTFEEIDGKFQAIEGAYDDNVFATALAYQMYLRLLPLINQGGRFAGIITAGERTATTDTD